MQKTIRCQEDAINFARAFGADAYHIMVWAGPPGLSKTRTIEETLGKANIVYLSGDVSPYQLYKDVYASREAGKIVIDDVETLIRNPLGTQLLKAFCQTEEVKVVGWHKATRDLAKDGIPRQYETSARFCLVCNDEDAIKKHLGPVIVRGVLVRFRYPAEEVHRMVGQWLHVNGIDHEVYDFIGSHLALSKVPSARLYKTASDTKKSNPGIDWREAVLETFGLDEDEVEVARLFSDPKFPSNSSRWVEFHRRGFGSRAKFYRIAGEMKLSDIKSEGDAAEGTETPTSSASGPVASAAIMEALGFVGRDSDSPKQPRLGHVNGTSASSDARTIPLTDRSGEPSRRGGIYLVIVRRKDGHLNPGIFVQADSWGQAKAYADSLTLEPGAQIIDVIRAGHPRGDRSSNTARSERRGKKGNLASHFTRLDPSRLRDLPTTAQ
jgi:hypothetical protein